MIGKTVGHYRITSRLGAGGMGEVFLAEDIRLERKAAIKFLPAEVAADPGRRQRFLTEARAASALNHPHVCIVYDVGETDDGLPFIAMEFVGGQSLDAVAKQKPLAISRVVEITAQVADALDAAHASHVVHRDIKPANISLNERGQVKVLDFGLAKRMIHGTDRTDVTQDLQQTQQGQVLGTPSYMSPEQALGQDLDHRTDIFSMGVVLYELTTGQKPFTGANVAEVVNKIVHEQPLAIARLNYNVPPELERITLKCLQKSPERRYQTARELMVDLRNLARALEHGRAASGPPLVSRVETLSSFAGSPGGSAAEPLSLEKLKTSDVLLTYAAIDDYPLQDDKPGWVSQLHRNLEVRMEQLSGEKVHIARLPEDAISPAIEAEILRQVPQAKAMISVLSPPFVNSALCRREVEQFWHGAEQTGGRYVKDKARLLKVLKTAVSEQQMPRPLLDIFSPLFGFEFFELDAETGRVREFDETFGPVLKQRFFERVYDLAYDGCQILSLLKQVRDASARTPDPSRRWVYLATTTSDVADERDRIKRELLERGHVVLPDAPLPMLSRDVETTVRDCLAKCTIAVHLLGQRYGITPEDSSESIPALQVRLTADPACRPDLQRLIWMPGGESTDERQRAFVRRVQEDPALHQRAEIIEGNLNLLKKDLIRRLAPPEDKPKAAAPKSSGGAPKLYLICDPKDEAAVEELEDHLFARGLEVMLPAFDGDDADAAALHQDNLMTCDAVLVYYGSAPRAWVDIKLRELLKATGYGRPAPIAVQAVYIAPPDDRRKDRFQSHQAGVIRQPTEFQPCAELDAFVGRIKEVRMSATPARLNPFPGLRPFTQDEDYLFFGREEQTIELLQRLGSHRFVAVVGTSGSGKSSLVRCGLLSELLGGRMLGAGAAWAITVTHPGGNPLALLTDALLDADLYDREEEHARENLLATLSRSHFGLVEAVKQADLGAGTNFLLVVDQFEEIFRFHEAGQTQQEAANEFVSLLLEAVAQKDVPIYVVLTMRSDFIGECGQFEGLAEMVNRGEFLIPRLTREQYKRVIEGPIKVAGGQIAPRLLQRLLNDLGQQADQLPCLQHALMRTWDVRAGNGDSEALDLDDYQRVGRMSQALSLHADEVYQSLVGDRQRALCRGMFQALTVEESNNRGIRRPQRLGRLCQILEVPADELRPIIDAYRHSGVTFLMPAPAVELTDQTIIDISHESLMRVWTRLRQWVEEETQAAGIYRRLSESAALNELGKTGLYRDPELGIALAWRDFQRPNAAWADRYRPGFAAAMAFLDTSRAAAEREEKEREAARQRELEQARRLAETQARVARLFKRYAVGLAVALCLAVALAIWAFMLRQEARRQEAAAKHFADEANTQAKLADDNARKAETEAQSALKAEKDAKDLATAEAAAKTLAQQETKRADDNARKAEERAAAARTAEAEARAQLTRAEWLVYAGKLSLAQTDFETGNGALALQYLDECQWNLRGWEHRYLWTRINAKLTLRDSGPLSSVAFDPDGKRILTGGWVDTTARVWDAETGRLLLSLPHGVAVRNVAFSPDRKRIVTGGGDVGGRPSEAKVWDAVTGQLLLTLQGYTGWVVSVAFSPDGQRIVTGDDRTATVWDAATGEVLCAFKEHKGRVWGLAFSPDGQRIVSAGGDSTVRLWDAATGQEIRTLRGHTQDVRGVAFNPDGKRIASAGMDGTVKVWDAQTGVLVRTFMGHTSWVLSVAFSPDGKHIASASADATVRVGTIATGQELALKGHTSHVVSVAYSPDGKRIVSASADHTARVWDAERGQTVLTLAGQIGTPVRGVAFSPDGQRIVTGSGVSDAATGQKLLARGAHGPVAFSPDGKRIIGTGGGNTATVWDAATGQEFVVLKGHKTQVLSVAFSPDGERIVTGAGDGRRPGGARVWDAATGEQLLALNGRVRVWSAAFSPDGKRIVTGDGDVYQPGMVKVWDAATGQEVMALREATNEVWSVAFSPDGKHIVSGSLDKMVRVWNADTGRLVFTLKGHTAGVWSVVFSPDGKRIFSGGEDSTIRVWDAGKGQELLAIKGGGSMHNVALSPDGKRLAGGSDDGTVKVWVAEAGQPPRNNAERMELLQDRLSALLRGEDKPADNVERLTLAQFAYDHRKFSLATRLWAEALASDPKLADDRQAQHRCHAARAAALAAAGEGQGEPPLDETVKAKLRSQALAWLKDDLATRTKLLETSSPQDRQTILWTLNSWKYQRDFAGIRDAEALARLPGHEQKALTQLWADWAELSKSAWTRHAVALQEQLVEARKTLPGDSPQLASLLLQRGWALLELQQWAEAEPLIRESLTIREKVQPNKWNTFNAQSVLGGSLLGQKKYAEAEALLLRGYSGMKEREATIPPAGKDRLPEALDRLIDFYTATNKPDEVRKWQAERAKKPEAPMPGEKK